MVLIGIPFVAMLYFLIGNVDIESMTDKEVFTTLGMVILCTIVAIACVIRLVFMFFILLDRRNFGSIGISASLQKSLELTRGKFIPILLSFLIVIGIC